MGMKLNLAQGVGLAPITFSIVIGAGASGVASAQTNASGPELEEVVVTARKKEESLNSVPLAVSAFSSAQIEARGLQNLVDISNFTPGFKFQNQAGGSSGRNDRTINTLIFRGLTLVNDSGTRAGSLLFVDGAPVIGGAAPGLQDVERVEVLRGPQSAFFGRSTFSGAVNIVTKDPPSKLVVRGSASYASYGSHTEDVSIGGPIAGDTLRARVSLTNEYVGGSWRNFAAPFERLGNRRTRALNAQILWKPVTDLRMKGSFTVFENHDGPPAQAAIKQDGMNCNLNPATVPQSFISTTPAAGNPQVANPQATNRYYCGEIPNADRLPQSTISADNLVDPLVRSAIIDNRGNFKLLINPKFQDTAGLRRRSYIGSFRLEYDNLPFGLNFSSTTSYHREHVGAILDLDFRDGRTLANPVVFNAANPSNPFYQFTVGYQTRTQDFSQEFRLTSNQSERFRYVLGANYISADDRAGVVYGQTILGSIFASAVSKFHPRTYAAFGAAYLDLASRVTLIGELRYQVDKVRQDSLSSTSGVALDPPPTFAKNYSSVSPRVTLNFKPIDNTLMYALFSRGYRPGGFNTNLSPALGAGPQVIAAATSSGYGLSYDQERLDNYEVGLKARLFGGRVQLNADAYYDKYTRGQISQTITFVTAAGTVNQVALVKNVGEIELKGIEGEVQWRAFDNLLLSSTFAINDSEIKNGYCSDCTTIYSAPRGSGATPLNNDLAGKRLPIAPKYTATFSGEYSHALTGSYDWFVRGDYAYRGRQFIDQANVAYVGAKQILNARLGVRNGRFSAELFCTNCLNDLTMDSAVFAQTDTTTLITGSRQEIRLGLPQRRMFGLKIGAKLGG